MAAKTLNLQKQLVIPDFKLEAPFCNNQWDVQTMDIYLNASKKHQEFWKVYGHSENSIIDFTTCQNPCIREEIKYFLWYLLNGRSSSLYNLTNVEARTRHLIKYINAYAVSTESVLYINEQDYTKFLLKEEIIPSQYMKAGNKINGDMEQVKTTRKHRTIALLGYVQSVIKDYYKIGFSFNNDYWEMKSIAFIDTSKHSNTKNLNFSSIQQEKMKEQIKSYCYSRLHVITSSSVAGNLGSLICFTDWLYDSFPEIKYFDEINREMIEDYIVYLRTETDCTERLVVKRISDLKSFLERGLILELDRFPESMIILPHDCVHKNNTIPEVYSDQEMKNINAALKSLPNIYAKIILCLEQLALRIEDLLRLEPSSLHRNEDGTYVLKIVQGKTSKPIDIYLKKSLYDLLIDQYKISQETYGNNVKYIFARSNNEHITYSNVFHRINSEFYRLGVKSDSGEILHFRTHKFRSTKASKLLAMGYDAKTAAKALGHSGLNSLAHYGKITSDLMIATMHPFLNKVDVLVNNIGKVQDIPKSELENALPLCNGWCCRPISAGICLHANYCLSCSMFKPDSRHLNYYSVQLEEVKATLTIAEADNNTLMINKLKKDKEQLEKIIEKVKSL